MTSSISQSTDFFVGKVKDKVFQNSSLNTSNLSPDLDKAHFSFNLLDQELSNTSTFVLNPSFVRIEQILNMKLCSCCNACTRKVLCCT